MERPRRVRAGEWSFDDDECWRHVSKEAKDFISRLLTDAPGSLMVSPFEDGFTLAGFHMSIRC